VIVRVPDQKVVYTGDLIFNGSFPACFDEKATISGWRATLKTFASWNKDTIFVPGHGQLGGPEGVQRLRDVFDDISDKPKKCIRLACR
jgi:cyclase